MWLSTHLKADLAAGGNPAIQTSGEPTPVIHETKYRPLGPCIRTQLARLWIPAQWSRLWISCGGRLAISVANLPQALRDLIQYSGVINS